MRRPKATRERNERGTLLFPACTQRRGGVSLSSVSLGCRFASRDCSRPSGIARARKKTNKHKSLRSASFPQRAICAGNAEEGESRNEAKKHSGQENFAPCPTGNQGEKTPQDQSCFLEPLLAICEKNRGEASTASLREAARPRRGEATRVTEKMPFLSPASSRRKTHHTPRFTCL